MTVLARRDAPPEPPTRSPARWGHAFGATRLALRNFAARIEAATPAGRDRSVDALRALAIAGVILGHWLVTALVLTRSPCGARLHDASPLACPARPGPGVVDLPDPRDLLLRRRLRGRALC